MQAYQIFSICTEQVQDLFIVIMNNNLLQTSVMYSVWSKNNAHNQMVPFF